MLSDLIFPQVYEKKYPLKIKKIFKNILNKFKTIFPFLVFPSHSKSFFITLVLVDVEGKVISLQVAI